ncbi:MAG: hypothetical protein HY841_14020 [Bacteroidetes bacterium]|nr:hypothetical protein [Bacteroidota bacterium]
MQLRVFFNILSLALFFFIGIIGHSQEEDEPAVNKKSGKGFHAGVYLGSFFANKYTTALYDGYGYDVDGKKNDFPNSFMYRRIVIDYGGGNGQTDVVMQALNVSHNDWAFDATDMPSNLKYNPAVMVGMNFFYGFTKKDALLLNATSSKLTLNGNFTIVITDPLIGPQQPGYQNIKTFSITGAEQRYMFQLGYRKILGDNDVFNFFVEAGPSLNIAKYARNQIAINNLQIDLTAYYSQPYYATYRARYLNGAGLGAFAGLGFEFRANAKWILQALYAPSYEKINIGENPKSTLQNALGLRACYRW